MPAQPAYTEDQVHFLEVFRGFDLDVITGAFNEMFGADKPRTAIRAFYSNHGIKRGRKAPGRGKGRPTVWTKEMIAFLRDNFPKMSIAQLTEEVNITFGKNFGRDAVHAACGRYGISSGRTGRIESGAVPWNKGVKGYMGANATSFKKGDMPANTREMYSERINRDGYVEIKVPEPNPYTTCASRFKHKHLWLYEQAHGPVPKGHAVIFADGNNRNFSLENLVCVSRGELLLLNLHGYKDQPAELKPSVVALAKLEAKAGFRTVRVAHAGRKKGTPNKGTLREAA